MAIDGTLCQIRLGKPGHGKSLDQTEEKVLEYLKSGQKVFCCYWINWNGDNYRYFPPTRQGWESIKNERNCVVVFDELAQIFEPRDWEGEGGDVRRWFQLHRHRHVNIIANTQDVSLVAKTVGIVADEWILCELEDNFIISFLLKILNLKGILISKSYLSYQQLKKIANGWELGEDVAIDIQTKRKWYSFRKIIHYDLDKYKVEYIHKYCPECCSRQGGIIIKEESKKIANYDKKRNKWTLITTEYCPAHPKTKLEIRESGMYDTDYEPEQAEQVITLQAMIKSPEGYRMIPYKGALSENQNNVKQRMERKLNSRFNK